MNDLDEILDSQDTAAEFPARRDAEDAQGDTDADIDDLMAFIARSDLAKNVKDTAVRKLTNPNLTWETIALGSKPPVATSTAWRGTRNSIPQPEKQGSTVHHCPTCEPPRTRCAANSPPFDPHAPIKGWPRQCYEHRQGR